MPWGGAKNDDRRHVPQASAVQMACCVNKNKKKPRRQKQKSKWATAVQGAEGRRLCLIEEHRAGLDEVADPPQDTEENVRDRIQTGVITMQFTLV